MYRPALRVAAKAPFSQTIVSAQPGKRFASTAASRSGTWKGAAVRWGAAGALVYYYNTSVAFAEEPQYAARAAPENYTESNAYPTVESVAEQRRAKAKAQLPASPAQPQTDAYPAETTSEAQADAPGDVAALEGDAAQQGAFNEETGEINWECPCLGGMAHGPCGEQFRAAFSCFVYSKEDPKGVDCIEHFKTMQNCFREHPEMYGAELDDEELGLSEDEEGQRAPASPEPQLASVDSQTPRESPSEGVGSA